MYLPPFDILAQTHPPTSGMVSEMSLPLCPPTSGTRSDRLLDCCDHVVQELDVYMPLPCPGSLSLRPPDPYGPQEDSVLVEEPEDVLDEPAADVEDLSSRRRPGRHCLHTLLKLSAPGIS